MAFVFKSDRKVDIKGNTDLGPGEYQGPSLMKIKKCSAPFNSTAMKHEPKCRQNGIVNQCGSHLQTPGPGSYQIQNDPVQQKVLISSTNQEVKIIQVPKGNSVFKSESKRFTKHNKNVPGPGSYNHNHYTDINRGSNQDDHEQGLREQYKQIKGVESREQNRLYEIVKQKNKNVVVPSVPSKQHVLGYNEGQHNRLELNRNPIYGSNQQEVGPGQYDMKDTFYENRKRGKTFGNTKSKRDPNRVKTSTNKNIGPGSYDTQSLQQNSQIYKFKASSQFMDRTKRLFTQDQFNRQTKKQKHQKSNGYGSLQGDQEEDQDQDQDHQMGRVPGPGTYFIDRPNTCFNNKMDQSNPKYQFFTFGCERFQGERSINTAGTRMGPGKYNVDSNQQSGKSFNTQKVSFNATGLRFNDYKEGYRNNPGPGQYNPKTTLEDVLVDRLQKGVKGKFGVKDKRFRQYESKEDKPGPGQYLDPNHYIDQLQQTFDQKTHFFKSKSQRNTFDQTKQQTNSKTTVPAVGNYQLDYYNMSRKMQKVKQEEHELEIKRPGFYSSQPRFTQLQKEPMMEDDENKQSVNDIQKKKQNDIQFNVKSKRFKTDQDNKPGPGQYNEQSNDQWNKRTYNILFADI